MQPPSRAIAIAVVEQIRARGLDGIAVTEHYDVEYGYALRELIEAEFGQDAPLIVPGREIYEGPYEVVELALLSGRVYRFMPHPGRPEKAAELSYPLHGIEIANGQHQHDISTDRVEAVAARLGLMLLRNSDAHSLSAIGTRYNELTLDTLEEAAAFRLASGPLLKRGCQPALNM